jgi:hypothetical protein
LTILRFLISASAILYGAVIVYSIYQNKTINDFKILFALIITFFGGIVVGFTPIEDIFNSYKKKYTGLAFIKQFIVGILWAWGVLMGVLFISALIYTIFKSI